MAYLSRLLSSLIIALISFSAQASPDQLDIGYWGLKENQKFLIRKGFSAPYNEAFTNRVIAGEQKIIWPDLYRSVYYVPHNPSEQFGNSVDLGNLEFNGRTLTQQEINFYFIHALDVYSTIRGLRWECIREQNPLLPGQPKPLELIVFKVGVISLIKAIYRDDPLWNEFMTASTYTTGTVVLRNFAYTEDAIQDQSCNKR